MRGGGQGIGGHGPKHGRSPLGGGLGLAMNARGQQVGGGEGRIQGRRLLQEFPRVPVPVGPECDLGQTQDRFRRVRIPLEQSGEDRFRGDQIHPVEGQSPRKKDDAGTFRSQYECLCQRQGRVAETVLAPTKARQRQQGFELVRIFGEQLLQGRIRLLVAASLHSQRCHSATEFIRRGPVLDQTLGRGDRGVELRAGSERLGAPGVLDGERERERRDDVHRSATSTTTAGSSPSGTT